MSDEQRQHYHKRESGPKMAELKRWLTEQIEQRKVEPNSSLCEAIRRTGDQDLRGGWGFVGNESHGFGKPIIRCLPGLLERIPNNGGHDLRFVQDQAGYASPTTTAIYAKTNVKARRRYVEALGAC